MKAIGEIAREGLRSGAVQVLAVAEIVEPVEVQGVGRALDLSPNGMMFETPDPIYVEKLSIRASTDKGNSLEVSAQLIYTMPNSPGVYRTGVQFTGAAEKIERFVAEMSNQSD